MLIALDAMGGDDAPRPEVAGALRAAAQGHRLVLVGDEPRLRDELRRQGADPRALGDLITLRHASEVITMRDHPGQAVRKKRDASMRVAFELVKQGQAQAVVSCGNSGAMLACGLFVLGRLPGVERPGIVVTFPTLSPGGMGRCALLDMGANVDCKPATLAQFAVLGATFARLHAPGMSHPPLVGLLANGEEESKGTALLRQAHALLAAAGPGADFEYAGFVEAREIFFPLPRAPAAGRCLDVVVTDGFTGNVVLKTAEGVARFLGELLKGQIQRSLLHRLGALLMRPALSALRRTIDVEGRGGALLIGVDGVVIICHGQSGPRAIASAVGLAAEQAGAGMAPAVTAAMARHAALFQEVPA